MYSVETVLEHLPNSLLLIIELLDKVCIETNGVELKVVYLVPPEVRGDGGRVYVRSAVTLHFASFEL